jgi:hypothetical protein
VSSRQRSCREAILASALLALGGCGDSPDGPVVVDEPPDPVQLRLAGAGPLADTLEWIPSAVSDFAVYRLFRLDSIESSAPDRAQAHLLAELDDISQSSGIDSTVSPGRTYAYWLEVADQRGQTGVSEPLILDTPRFPAFGVGLAPRLAIVAPGDTLELEIWIESAPAVFGMAMDLSLPTAIELLECVRGEFLGEDALVICLPQANGLGLSLTRIRGADPVEGFGVLARLQVRVREAGQFEIGFTRAPEFRDENGVPTTAPAFWGSRISASSSIARWGEDTHALPR